MTSSIAHTETRGLWYGFWGVARVGQIQLLQPFLTLVAAGLLFGESVTGTILIFAVIMVVIVAVGKNMPVTRQHTNPEKNN